MFSKMKILSFQPLWFLFLLISNVQPDSEEKLPAYTVEQLNSPLSVTGEGPHWDEETQSLYYVDMYDGKVNRYSIADNMTYTATVENESFVSFIIPVEGSPNEFIIGVGKSRVGVISWDGLSSSTRIDRLVGDLQQIDRFETNQFNDGKCDRTGRLYTGTMRDSRCGNWENGIEGSLFKYDKERKQFDTLKGGIGVSNGLAWNYTTNKFYYIDSCQLDVKEFDYDPNTGAILNERRVIDFRTNGNDQQIVPTVAPTGMTIDTRGLLYVAMFGGSKIVRVDPSSGQINLVIELPTEQITSSVFGGPNLDILFVTTARVTAGKHFPPPGGALLKVTGLNAIGTKMYRANI